MTLLENPYSYEGSAASPRQESPPVDVIYWIPDGSVTLHNGQPIPRRMVFPYPPPLEIGRVFSAERWPWWPWRGLLQHWAICALLFSGLILWIHFSKGVNDLWYALAMVNLLVLAFVVGFAVLYIAAGFALDFICGWRGRPRFKPLITYVGQDGCALWQHSRFLRSTECRTILFRDIEQLFEGNLIDVHGNQLYCTGNMLFTDEGYEEFSYLDHEIERAWCNYFLERWFANWNSTGNGVVQLSPSDRLICSPRQLTLQRGDETLEFEVSELKKLRLTYDHKLTFSWRDHSVEYPVAEMPNAHAALAILPHVMQRELSGQKLLTSPTGFFISTRAHSRKNRFQKS